MHKRHTFSLGVSVKEDNERTYILFWHVGFESLVGRVNNIDHAHFNVFSSALALDIAVIVMRKALFLWYLSTCSKLKN